MPTVALASLLLKWYRRHARDLPWRKNPTPYRTWVSEVMLQQTRVETVIPYYRRWMRRFPSMRVLAGARERDVLSLWEGLGYYSRARNLHRAARILVREHNGRLPSDPALLRRLPGVGEYIAAAIGSIAFGSDVPALDANVLRVLARLASIRLPLASPQARQRIRRIGEEHLPHGRAGEFNQALMDLGALVCLPRMPKCELCPLIGLCEAHARGLQNHLPIRAKPLPRPQFYSNAAVVLCGDRVLLTRRPGNGLLGGLWEFPKSNRRPAPTSKQQFIHELQAAGLHPLRLLDASAPRLVIVQHSYSHFAIRVDAYLYASVKLIRRPGAQWVLVARLPSFPMGKVDRTIAGHLASRNHRLQPSPRRQADSTRGI